MRRDMDRAELPGGSAWNMVDFIPDELAAAVAGRGGWTYYSPDTGTAPTSWQAVSYHPDVSKLVGIATTTLGPKLYDLAAGTVIGAIADGAGPVYPVPVSSTYHRGYLIFPAPKTAIQPSSWDGTTLTTIAAAPPATTYAATYKDHAILANGVGNTNRLWFSSAGDPTAWDLTYGWWDTSKAITGIGTLTNAILIFHADSTERLRGTTPPPGSDMVLEPFLNYGCLDNRSVVQWRNRLVFASSQGIFMTDGVTDLDLTASAGMKTYWQSIMANFTGTTWTVAAGVYRDHYILTLVSGSTVIDCLCVSLRNQTMWRLSNLSGSSFCNVTVGQQEKLYMGQTFTAGHKRVIELSSLWSPSSTVKQDGDGTNPTPIIETGMFRGYDRLHRRWIQSMGKQKWRWSYVDYDLRDSASDNPTATLSYCTTPTGSYTQAGLAIPKTTDYARARRALSPTQGGAKHSNMLGLKYAVTGPYAAAKLYALEAAYEPIEIGSL